MNLRRKHADGSHRTSSKFEVQIISKLYGCSVSWHLKRPSRHLQTGKCLNLVGGFEQNVTYGEFIFWNWEKMIWICLGCFVLRGKTWPFISFRGRYCGPLRKWFGISWASPMSMIFYIEIDRFDPSCPIWEPYETVPYEIIVKIRKNKRNPM